MAYPAQCVVSRLAIMALPGRRGEGRMLAKVLTGAVVGMDGALVEVEVDIAQAGLPNFLIVGLPDAAVQEARERVRAAIRNSGLSFPMRRITVNLAPADLKKEGPSYDLPIAVGILIASGQLEADATGVLYLGELSLDGAERSTSTPLAIGIQKVSLTPAEGSKPRPRPTCCVSLPRDVR